jgi:hypothetical protein
LDELAYLEDWLGRAQRRLDELHPMVGVELDTQTPGFGRVKRGLVPGQLPGTSAADLRTDVPAIKATTDLNTTLPPFKTTNVPPASDLRTPSLMLWAAHTLGVDPASVEHAGTVTAVALVGGAALAVGLSVLFPQARLAVAPGTLNGGLTVVPFMTADRRVDG